MTGFYQSDLAQEVQNPLPVIQSGDQQGSGDLGVPPVCMPMEVKQVIPAILESRRQPQDPASVLFCFCSHNSYTQPQVGLRLEKFGEGVLQGMFLPAQGTVSSVTVVAEKIKGHLKLFQCSKQFLRTILQWTISSLQLSVVSPSKEYFCRPYYEKQLKDSSCKAYSLNSP